MNLPSAYEPTDYEADIYTLWEKNRVFKADPTSSKPHFSISMPPPNETGTLGVHHAIFLTLQDIMIRHARQKGKDALWLPGTDHAALPVNALIEKQLAEQGTSKHEVGREEFLRRTREFVAGSRQTMIGQMRAIGASADWSRLRYTLDDTLNRCVHETFVKMFNDGLIYRGHRIVNWDPKLQTTVSDDEVTYTEERSPFYTLQFGPFQIGTARPETKFGDKYIVMHPDDERYKQYKDGESFECEWINGKITATVVKDSAVDPSFGTGVMTITPWHDHTDFDIAERHGLEKAQIIDFDGKLLPIAGEFAGQSIAEARPKIVEKLQAKGLLVNVDEEYVHNIALNDRGKGVIEPQIKLQWFVDVNRPVVEWKGQLRSLKEVMRVVIDDQDIQIIPKRFDKVYFHWIDNLRDWCISRQIWWGHQIPVWYKGDEIYAGVRPPEGKGWEQDPDTLDTWFSSALWTWSTLIDQDLAKDYSIGLEDLLIRSQDFQAYHPTSVLETGWDILFFWVARMILATTYMTGQVPFKTVYLHGLVRTESGRKMSKSDPSTVIDPLQMIDKYGADALRLALIAGTSAGNDQRTGQGRIIANRNFCNKLWNIARYVEASAAEGFGSEAAPTTAADHWIFNKLSITSSQINENLENYRFSEAYDSLYHFVWDDLADWYIEASKVNVNQGVLAYVLKQTLLLAHPFAPFVTEAIWQSLNVEQGTILAKMEQSPPTQFNKQLAGDFEDLKLIVSTARRYVQALEIKNKILIYANSELIKSNVRLIKKLGRLDDAIEQTELKNGLRLPLTKFNTALSAEKEEGRSYLQKLDKEKSGAQEQIKTLKGRLENRDYVANAPEELVSQSRVQLEACLEKIKLLDEETAIISDWLNR